MRRGLLSRLTSHGRAGSAVLAGALLAGVLVASFGIGYSTTTPDLDNPTNNLAKGNSVVTVNSETQRVEAEARALATGDQEIEVVALSDGRVATVNNTTKEVLLFTDQLQKDSNVTQPNANTPAQQGEELVVVPAKGASYLLNPAEDVVQLIGLEGQPTQRVPIPNGASRWTVPDGGDGIWVLTDDGKAAHVVRDRVDRVTAAPGKIEHITVADGRPVVITESGAALDIATEPLKSVTSELLPHGRAVEVGSPKGAGRYLLALDRTNGRLVVVDPRTRAVHKFTDLPVGPPHILGAPVVLDDRVYIPDYAKAKQQLYVRDLRSGSRLDNVPVPGEHGKFSLEVRERRVWANDQFDLRAVVLGRDGRPGFIDKGMGTGVDSDTEGTPEDKPDEKPSQQPLPKDNQPTNQNPPPTTKPRSTPTVGPPPTTKPEMPPTTTTTAPKPPPLVTVPVLPPGTKQDEACDRIKAVKLRCEIVEIGSGGPTGTVRDTDPPSGSRMPEHSVVRVYAYGPITVPDVVGRRSDPACQIIEPRQNDPLDCDKQPMSSPGSDWSQLDIVAVQDPKSGQKVDAGSTVTVKFWNSATIGNLVDKNGTDECNNIITSSHNLVKCDPQPGGEAPSAAQEGQVASQSPPAGTAVQIGQTIVLTIYGKRVPRVPTIPQGTEINQACVTVLASGYTCDRRPDALARHANAVTAQEPAAGTPQQGGSVALHYAPYEPVPIYRYRAVNGDPVWFLRAGQDPGVSTYYKIEGVIGYGYAHAWPQPGTWPINDFHCTSGPSNCYGFQRNHYTSRAQTPGMQEFNGPDGVARFINSPDGQCPAGQIPMERFRYWTNGKRRYYVGQSEKEVGWPDPRYEEWLGCIWSP